MEGVRVVEERCHLDSSALAGDLGAGSASGELRHRLRVHDQAHADAVTALAAADLPGGGGRLLLSASRDGIVKAWK
eukprot:215956-Chlamydomonas_euryale.AAC.1